MAITIAVLRERKAGECRVAMVPSVVAKLTRLGAEVTIESKAGETATFSNDAYAGVRIESETDALIRRADIVLGVQAPAREIVDAMKPGALLICQLNAIDADIARSLLAQKISTFAMERIPRISRAQSMDVLSSQAALAGYYAPLLGAVHMPRILPMMTTAVGSLRAARVLVMGLGVAGLSALATAHRLGAVTEGYDVRPETKDQAQSLGAKFVETGIDARGDGGYARELTGEEKAKVQAILAQHISQADMIITTASVPGRPSPRLISSAQIAAMKPGAVIIDLGAEGGGNCEGTRPGETVKLGGVTLIGPLNVPSALAQHASELYAKNIVNLLELIVKHGAIHLDFDDEIIDGAVVIHDGEIRNKALRRSIDATTHPSEEIA